MKVYRVERKGKGPYNISAPEYWSKSDSLDWYDIKFNMEEAHCGYEHPSWKVELWDYDGDTNYDWISPEYYSCFLSVDDLISWFHGFFADLHRFEFEMAVYDVDEKLVIKGSRQAVAKLGDDIPIESIKFHKFIDVDTDAYQEAYYG